MEDNLSQPNYSYSKKFLLFFILLILFTGGVSYYLFYNRQPEVQVDNIYKFNGSPIEVEGQAITLKGTYLASETIPESLASVRYFTFLVDSKTVFNKREIQWPDWEESTTDGKTSETFNFEDLPRTDSIGSLTDFKYSLKESSGNIYVMVDFSSPIENVNNPTAQSVYYELMNVPFNSQNL